MKSDLKPHIQTGSCYTRCKEPDLDLCSSWEHRSSCPHSDRVAHDDDDCEENKSQQFIKTVQTYIFAHTVFLPKGASLHILTAETHVNAFHQKRAEGHVFTQSPVHRALLHHPCPSFQNTCQTLVDKRSGLA